MKCIHCNHLDLQSNDAMAKLGLGSCKVEPVSGQWVSFRFDRVCKRYEQVIEEVEAKRTEWSENNLKARMLRN